MWFLPCRHIVCGVTLYCCPVAIATVVHKRHIAYSMHVTIYTWNRKMSMSMYVCVFFTVSVMSLSGHISHVQRWRLLCSKRYHLKYKYVTGITALKNKGGDEVRHQRDGRENGIEWWGYEKIIPLLISAGFPQQMFRSSKCCLQKLHKINS
jgi:hypothetical protein